MYSKVEKGENFGMTWSKEQLKIKVQFAFILFSCIFVTELLLDLKEMQKEICNNVIQTHHHLFYKLKKHFSCGLTNCFKTWT